MRIFILSTIFMIQGFAQWQTQTSSVTTSLRDISRINENSAVAVGDDGKIIRTNDGGKTWDVQETGTTKTLQSVEFISETRGWVCGEDVLLRTTNGGANWIQVEAVGDELAALDFVSPEKGWMISGYHILHTSDGGKTWSAQYQGVKSMIFDIFFLDEQNGWAVGGKGIVFRTTNGGANWHSAAIQPDIILYSVFFANKTHGWCVSNGSIFASTDGGITWDEQHNSSESNLFSIHFSTPKIGLISGTEGFVLKTIDGGQQWESIPVNASGKRIYHTLYSLSFDKTGNGLAVGTGGTILSFSEPTLPIHPFQYYPTHKIRYTIISNNSTTPLHSAPIIRWSVHTLCGKILYDTKHTPHLTSISIPATRGRYPAGSFLVLHSKDSTTILPL